jgi:hypothetical protein
VLHTPPLADEMLEEAVPDTGELRMRVNWVRCVAATVSGSRMRTPSCTPSPR